MDILLSQLMVIVFLLGTLVVMGWGFAIMLQPFVPNAGNRYLCWWQRLASRQISRLFRYLNRQLQRLARWSLRQLWRFVRWGSTRSWRFVVSLF